MLNGQARRLGFMAAMLLLGQTGEATAQTSYHVDASGGSDRGDGLAPERAWQSLGRVNQARPRPGDRILLRRGETWTGQIVLHASGRAEQPITIAAYGTGPNPILTGARNGIDGNGQSHIVVRDIQIRNTSGPAIRSTGSSNWRIERVSIDRAGSGHDGRNREFAGIQFWNSNELVIAGSTLTNVRGDGIWIWDVKGLKLLGNRVEVCQGAHSDNVHLYAPRNFEVRGNYFSMEGKTDSGKGNFHSQSGDHGVIEDNEFRGGTYGVGNTDNNLTIRNNRFIGHNREKWSAGIIVSEVLDVKNNTFIGNTIIDATMGVYIFRDGYNRENFQIRDNVFERIRSVAVVIESPVSGELSGNVLRDSPGARVVHTNGWLVRGQHWQERANAVLGAAPEKASRSGQPR